MILVKKENAFLSKKRRTGGGAFLFLELIFII